MKGADTLALLAKMADDWNLRTLEIINMAVGATLLQCGVASVSFSEDDMREVTSKWEITRTMVDSGTAGKCWTITIAPRSPHNQEILPL